MLQLLLVCAAAHESELPLITRLRHESGHGRLDEHAQGYGALHRARRLSLTPTNTAPIRLHLDFASLDQATAPAFSACFAPNAWFRRGFPTSHTPPADGVATCARGAGPDGDASTTDCWGRCLASDVISAAAKARVVEVVTAVAAELPALVSLQPVSGNLAFSVSDGLYARAIQAKGYPTSAACAADCAQTSQVAVDPSYCAAGVEGVDAVLSVTKPPGVHGLGGTGGACASDQRGRALWLVFAWISSVVDIEQSTLEQAIEQYRDLIMHEIIHGLGFSQVDFSYARNADGGRKNLLARKIYTDEDGVADEVWEFTRGRAFEAAKTYFGCEGDAAASFGLPLMGLPDRGRGSHWETRIMRDDIMSYGGLGTVSALTLAALEDLGHYLANYTNGGCMAWGFRQGCAFVSSRCGIGSHDSSAVTAAWQDCSGDAAWSRAPMAPSQDRLIESKCSLGVDPCSRITSGFIEGAPAVIDGGKRCDAQCYRGTGWASTRLDCSQGPGGEVEGSSVLGALLADPFTRWWLWAIPVVCLLVGISWIFIFKSMLCPKDARARTQSLLISVLLAVVGIAATTGSSWMYVHYEAFQAFLGMPSVIGCMVVAIFTLVTSCFVLGAVHQRATFLMAIASLLLLALCLTALAGTLLFIYWVYAYDGMAFDSLSVMAGSGKATHVTRFLDTAFGGPLAIVEGAICKTYQLCCLPPAFAAAAANGTVATCLQAHEGSLSDIEVALRDPSHPHFCAYVTGSPLHLLVAPPPGTCAALSAISSDFDMGTCQADFCASGLDGHVDFASKMVALFRRYVLPVGGCCAFMVLLLLVYSCNVCNARGLELARQGKISPAGALASRLPSLNRRKN